MEGVKEREGIKMREGRWNRRKTRHEVGERKIEGGNERQRKKEKMERLREKREREKAQK